MVGVIRRSLSFPNKINPNHPPKPPISHHTRSISLPCRSHPLFSHLKDEITHLKSWSSKPKNRSSTWLLDGLNRLKDVHDSLSDILQLPHTQLSLGNRPDLIENLLEHFLKLVDVYGIFQTSVLALKEEQASARVAIRKKDEAKVTLYLKSRNKISQEIAKLSSMIKLNTIKQEMFSIVSYGHAEVADVVREVVDVTALVSVALFNGVYCSLGFKKITWIGSLGFVKKEKKIRVDDGIEELSEVGGYSLRRLKKMSDEEVKILLKKMEKLDLCICGVENGSDKVFRSLINTRVSLLNTFTGNF